MKISEIFYSLQGEGLHIGTPSIFLRVFGCNLKCRGFGMSTGELSDEYKHIDPDKYSSYKDLPLVKTGCDSYASWAKEFKQFSRSMTIDEIINEIEDLLPCGIFGSDLPFIPFDSSHLIITGGEPLLKGNQKNYILLLKEISKRNLGLKHITFETNGTQPLTDELKLYLEKSQFDITFSVSMKLSSSGESMSKRRNFKSLESYKNLLNSKCYLKFVINSDEDIIEVIDETSNLIYCNLMMPIYLMPVGGTKNEYQINEKRVADLAMSYGFKFSPRLQVSLWKNEWGT